MYTLRTAAQRKVIFLGLRGIPEIQGGVETHVAALAGVSRSAAGKSKCSAAVHISHRRSPTSGKASR